MTLIDLNALRATALKTDPYDYLVVPNFVASKALGQVIRDYPNVTTPGSVPPSELEIHGHFDALMKEMNGPAFEAAIEEKFGLDLSGRPTMFTVRGHCRDSDGKIHPDSKTKIIAVLLYLNKVEEWGHQGGKLRILRSPTDLDDFADEVPPYGGTLLVFRRAGHSWHGHKPFKGPRRAVQMNWVTDHRVVLSEQRRHRFSSTMKRLNPFSAT